MSKSPKKAKKSHFSLKMCLMVILVVYFSISIIGQQSDINALNGTINEYNSKISDKNSELNAIEDEIKNSGSDSTVERIARERLGLVRSDETVFVDVTGN